MHDTSSPSLPRHCCALVVVGLGLTTGCPSYTEVASGFELSSGRAALADDGTVVTTAANTLVVTDGDASSAIDLASHGLSVAGVYNPDLALQVRMAGDVVFMANRESEAVDDCDGYMRGVYSVQTDGQGLSLLHESCHGDEYGRGVAMSTNGTIAFSTVVSSSGAIYRGPISGPVSVLQPGSSEFYNNRQIAVNNAGRVMLEMEYVDGFAGGLMRGLLAFDEALQTKSELDTAIEKLGVGVMLAHAINNDGIVVFSINNDSTMAIGGVNYPVAAGVYYALPTAFNTPKDLTAVATRADGYCRFGNVDINDENEVVFEATVGSGTCSSPNTGIYSGPDPAAGVVIARGDKALGSHRYFDDIRLGELNNTGQISFTTTYSEPLVDPVKVWRRDQ